MATATVRGVTINYEVFGEDGPWVALMTGGRRGYGEFKSLAGKLSVEGFRVLLHDRRNTGASSIAMSADEVEEAVWADDLRELLGQLDALPVFVGGSSSGARTSILFGIRHPDSVRGLLLLRVTGGPFAANRLPELYYDQFIRAAKEGGMAAVCATDAYQERIVANSASGETLMAMDPDHFIDIMSRLRELFVAGADLPVMGATPEELAKIKAASIVIPGNDNTHASSSGLAAHELIPGSELHRLPIEDQDVPLIPFDEWEPYEAEITQVFAGFMRKHLG
jgi:pimeloyl-ACP methyl ester carboxylesterase